MRKLILIILMLIFSFNVYADIGLDERQKIENFTDGFLYNLLEQDFEEIEQTISPNARPGLMDEIKDSFGGIKYQTLGFYPTKFKEDGNLIRVQGSYDYDQYGGRGSGSLGFFILERNNDSYLIVDTNFHKTISSFKYAIKYALYEYPLSYIGISVNSDSKSLPRTSQILIGLGVTAIIMIIILFVGNYVFKEFRDVKK